jgi:2-oxoisovalerate dehydrogenase E1 component
MAKNPSKTKLDQSTLEQMYTTMRRIRGFEERMGVLFDEGVVKGTVHSCIGQEAVAAGVCSVLRDDDYIASTHRGHGHCIAKGARLDLMMAELMGRETGYGRGLGGSMHIADMDLNILGANGIVGPSSALATGAALTARLRGSDQVSVAFFGDGGANEGLVHEAMNLAAVWKLPVVFVCENNRYALTMPFEKATGIEHLSLRAASYGMPGVTIYGNDPVEVHRTTKEAVDRARAGDGPTLIECMTYRWGQHSGRANLADPRPEDEVAEWIARDPLVHFEKKLVQGRTLSRKRADEITATVNDEVEAAVKFGLDGPVASPDILATSIYSPHIQCDEPGSGTGRELSYAQALNEALHQEMERDPEVFVTGLDIGETGGLFRVTDGLFQAFGAERVRDTPMSEAGFVGAAVGAAVSGMRPVVEIQFMDFITVAMDLVVNQAAKLRFMLGGKAKVPIVIRGPQGGGIRLAAQHSQSLEAWFAHIPGLVVVMPSTPYDAKGLLISAIRDDNPVIFLESKMLYLEHPGPVPEEIYAIPLGKADVKRQGTDVTVVATSAMVPRALSAALLLERQSISVEVIDPRTILPLDEETILASVRKTNRLLIVHEACERGGFGAEVAAMVMSKAFDYLDAPIQRVGAPFTPMPFADELERFVIPSTERIVEAVRALL